MMKTIIRPFFPCLLLFVALTTKGQTVKDSADIFYRHLDLSEIVVTGLTGDTKLKNSPSPISVISNKTLRATAATNVVDAIAHEPGVAQLTTGSSISKPIIRGLGYNRIICMADGVRQEGQQWGDEHGLELDANSVGSVEIIKGPASLMYGADAMAGVLIFKPHTLPIEGETRGNVISEYQTNNGLYSVWGNVSAQHGGLVLDMQLGTKSAHAYRNRYDGYVPGSQFGEYTASVLAGINRSWGHSHLRISSYQLIPTMPEGERDPMTGQLVCFTDNVKTYKHGMPYQKVYHDKMVWDNAIGLGPGMLKAIVGFQQNRRQEFEESADQYGLYLRQKTLSYDLRYQVETESDWKLATGVGGVWQQTENKGEEVLIPASHLFDAGLFATAARTLDDWELSGGARIDHRHLLGHALEEDGAWRFMRFSRDFTGVTGSVGAVWHASDALNLRMNVARGFRTPNMSELASNGEHEGTLRYEVGNTELKAEYSLQADLGLDFSSRYVSAQVAVFANRIDNFIFASRCEDGSSDLISGLASADEEELPRYDYTQGNARLWGFEAGFDFHPIHCVHFASTFSMVNAELRHQPIETRYLPLTPAPRWTVDLKYEITHQGSSFLNNAYLSFGMEHTMRQDRYYRADNTETATPAYTLFNASASTDVLVSGRKVCEIYIVGSNLFNKCYQSHLSRLKYTDVNAVTGRMGVFNMGRNITFKLVIPFSHNRS